MDEIEMRLAALELLATHLVGWLTPQAREDVAESVRLECRAGLDPDELAIRRHALQLIEDGTERAQG